MYIPKRYGESKSNNCPFCGKVAITQTKDGIPVCLVHKNSDLGSLKCACGLTLEQKKGKFGPFFTCVRCGAVNFKKAMAFNSFSTVKDPVSSMGTPLIPKKEIVVRSDELDF